MRNIIATTVALAAMAMPAAAQQQGHAQHGQGTPGPEGMQGMEHCLSMMGAPPPGMMLRHQEELGLSADQVGQLETLKDEAGAQSHRTEVMAAHARAAAALESDDPDWPAYEAALRAAADHMVQAHTAMAKAAVEAGDVLSAAQREQLAGLDHGMSGMMPGMAGDGGGHMGMMGCMMMSGMSGMSGMGGTGGTGGTGGMGAHGAHDGGQSH